MLIESTNTSVRSLRLCDTRLASSVKNDYGAYEASTSSKSSACNESSVFSNRQGRTLVLSVVPSSNAYRITSNSKYANNAVSIRYRANVFCFSRLPCGIF